MAEEVKISVITPTYNRAHILKRAIESVLVQNDPNIEYIIVDDCSTDNTESLIEKYHNENIIYIKLDVNIGNAGARNVGVKVAHGQYIAFLDSDDEFEINALKIFRNTLRSNPHLDYAFGTFKVLEEKTNTVKIHKWIPNSEVSFLEDLRIGTGCGLFVNKKCFDIVGFFDENLRVAVDTDWLIRLDRKYRYTLIDDNIIIVHAHEGERVRKDKSELLKSYKIIYKKNKEIIDSKQKLRKRFYYKIQWLNYHQKNNKEGNKFCFNLIIKGDFLKKSILSFFIFNIFSTSFAKELHYKMSKNVFKKNRI